MTPDPIKLAGGLNSYQYVPNPTGWVDPLGLSVCPDNNSSSTGGAKTPSTAATIDEGTPNSPKPQDQSGYNAARFERLRAGYAADEIKSAKPIGSALKDDPMHRAPSYVVDQIPDKGRVFPLRGGDGTNNTLTQMPGSMNNKPGIFEWIVNSKMELTHQRFIPDGRITGTPNQIPSRLPK